MHLTTFISRPDESGKVKSSIAIMIDYDPKENMPGEILSVHACDHVKNTIIDVTELFIMDVSNDLEKLIVKTDWRELYREAVRKAA